LPLKRPYLFTARLDLFFTFDGIANLNILTNKQSPKPNIHWQKELPDADFREICHSRIPNADLPPEHVAILEKFADQVADTEEECRKTGRVTEEARELIDAYEKNRAALYRRLFKQEPMP